MQTREAGMHEKVQGTIPPSPPLLARRVRTPGEKVPEGKEQWVLSGRWPMPGSACGHRPRAKAWGACPFVSSFSTPAPCCFLATAW